MRFSDVTVICLFSLLTKPVSSSHYLLWILELLAEYDLTLNLLTWRIW
jgi:hypothetical protein